MPDIDQLTTEILTLSDTLERDRAESVVEIGEKMLALREVLAHGEWGAWIELVPYTEQSARNYMGLAEWAGSEPGAFLRLKSLGPTKLYALQRLSPDLLAELPEPGSGEEPQLDRMSVAQVHALVRELAGTEPATIPISRVLASGERRVRGLAEVVGALVDRRKELDDGAIDALRTQLAALLDALDRVS